MSGVFSPAILIDADLPPPIISEEGFSAEHELAVRYDFTNAIWRYSSDYIVTKLVELHKDAVGRVLLGVLAGLNNSHAVFNRAFGGMHGMLLEHYAPELVIKNGLKCTQISDDANFFIIQNGSLEVVLCDRRQIEDVFLCCTDPTKLYFFGDNNPAFDFFVPPNNFFNTTSTLTKSGSHDISLSAAIKICQQLKDKEAKFVFVVPESEKEKWSREQSFLIKDNAVLEELDAHGKPINFGGVRSFKKLPVGTQQLLGNFRQYLAPLNITKSYYSTAASSRGGSMVLMAALRKMWRK